MVPENLFDVIGLSPEPLNRCGWSLVSNILSFYNIRLNTFYFLAEDHGHDFRYYFFLRVKFFLGFHTGLKFFSRDLFLDQVELEIDRNSILTVDLCLGTYFWPTYALESFNLDFGQERDPVPNRSLGILLRHLAPNNVASLEE